MMMVVGEEVFVAGEGGVGALGCDFACRVGWLGSLDSIFGKF